MFYVKKDIDFQVAINDAISDEDFAKLTSDQQGFYTQADFCDACGDLVLLNDLTEVNDGKVCPTCLAEEYVRCDSCDKYFCNVLMKKTFDGDMICDECFDQYYDICVECGEIYPFEQLQATTDGFYICDDCLNSSNSHYVKCYDCGNITPKSTAYTLGGDRGYICHGCWDNGEYGFCEDCDLVFPYNELSEGDDRGYYCDNCIDDHRTRNVVRKHHSKKDLTSFRKKSPTSKVAG